MKEFKEKSFSGNKIYLFVKIHFGVFIFILFLSNFCVKNFKFYKTIGILLIISYRIATKATKNPMVLITVLYVKKAFKKVTSNNKTIVYTEPKKIRIESKK